MASVPLPKLGAGGIRARSGGTAPAAVAGYTVKGLGHGNWEYLPGKPAPVKYTNPAPVTPFLNPEQQTKLTQYDTRYGYNTAALQRALGDRTASTNMALATNQMRHDVSANNVNQSTAARGMFQSSIRATDLNDLDTSLTMRNNILNTNLNRFAIDTQSRLNQGVTDYTTTHNLYNTMAVQNAQGVPPVVPTAIPAVKPTAWTPPAQPAAPKQGGQSSYQPPIGPLSGSNPNNAAIEQGFDNVQAGKAF